MADAPHGNRFRARQHPPGLSPLSCILGRLAAGLPLGQAADERWAMLILFFSITALWLAIGSVSVTGIGYSGLLYASLTWLMLPIYLHTHLVIPRRLPGAVPGTGLAVLYAVGTIGVLVTCWDWCDERMVHRGHWRIRGEHGYLAVSQLHPPLGIPTASHAADAVRDRHGLLPLLAGLPCPHAVGSRAAHTLGTAIALLALPALPWLMFTPLFKRQFGDLEFRANRVLGLYTFILAYSTAYALVFVLVSAWIPRRKGT